MLRFSPFLHTCHKAIASIFYTEILWPIATQLRWPWPQPSHIFSKGSWVSVSRSHRDFWRDCSAQPAILSSISAHISEGPTSWRNTVNPIASSLLQSLVRCLKTHQNLTSFTQMRQKGEVSERGKTKVSPSSRVLYPIFPSVMVRGLFTLVI